jgi:hypothetical protein
MILNKIGTNDFIVNLLSEFILNKIGKNTSTKIQVIDCINFFIIKGKTSSKEVLNLSEILSDFKKTYDKEIGDKKITHSIDLIEYDYSLDDVSELEFTLHDSINCSYSQEQIDMFETSNNSLEFHYKTKLINNDNLIYTSQFPFGYSLNQGRLLYYFIKKVFYSIPTNYIAKNITIKLCMSKTDDDKIEVFDNLRQENDKILKSTILDHVDFNLNQLEKEMKELDWIEELTNPINEYPQLKENDYKMIIL